MKYQKVFQLAKPFLKKTDFGLLHTQRVFDIAINNFEIPQDLKELIYCSIILHDIGGSSIKKQYEEDPKIACSILLKLGYRKNFIDQVCEIVCTHHNHPNNPSLAFMILYDSDKLVMFSTEEFSYYNSQPNFNWNQIINLIYHKHARDLAKELLQLRKAYTT
jgi:hypothetical protein